MAISAVVLTKNSSATLEKCLNSIVWCDEIVVIDDNSTDNTKDIAKKHNVKLFYRTLGEDFSKQRNFSLEKAGSDWIFFVDSDEIISPLLKEEVIKCVNNPVNAYEGYLIKREDTLWGRKLHYGEVGNIWLLRLARKNSGEWQGKVHETWDVKGKVGKLNNPIEHFPHPTLSKFLSKINFYSTLRSRELYNRQAHVTGFYVVLYPKGKFIINYFFKLGFLDGIPGFLVAMVMSFHSFLVRGKLWQLQNTHQ